MKTKKRIDIVLFVVLFSCLILVAGSGAAEKKTIISIGHIPNLTGPYAAGQACYGRAGDAVIEWANANNYIPGVELKTIWVDGGTDVSKSMTGFKKLMAEEPKPVLVIGQSTPTGVALKKWYEAAKVPSLEGGFAVSIVLPPSWTFCVHVPTMNQAGAWIDYYLKNEWKGKKPPKFAWLTWDSAFGRNCITKEIEAYIKSKGIEIVASEFIPMVPSDTTAHLMRLKQLGVDFTFGNLYAAPLSVVLKDIDRLGMAGKLAMAFGYGLTTEELINYAGPLANGVYRTSCYYGRSEWPRTCPQLLNMFVKTNARDLDVTGWGHVWSCFATAIEAVRVAAATVGPEKVDGQAVYEALMGLSKFDPWGTGPPVSYSKTRRIGMDSVIIDVAEGQKVVFKGLAKAPDVLPGGKDVPK